MSEVTQSACKGICTPWSAGRLVRTCGGRWAEGGCLGGHPEELALVAREVPEVIPGLEGIGICHHEQVRLGCPQQDALQVLALSSGSRPVLCELHPHWRWARWR